MNFRTLRPAWKGSLNTGRRPVRYEEDPPGGLGTTLEQTFDQGLGARIRLVIVLLRWPSTYVSRQIS